MAVVCVKCKGIFDSLLICSVDFGAFGWMEILFFCDIWGRSLARIKDTIRYHSFEDERSDVSRDESSIWC